MGKQLVYTISVNGLGNFDKLNNSKEQNLIENLAVLVILLHYSTMF